MTTMNKWYSYLRVASIQIDVHPAAENPTNTPYTSHAQSAYGPKPYVSHVVNTYQPFVSHRQIWTDPTAPEKKGSRHNPQHAGRSIYGSVPNFSPKPTNEAVSLSHAYVDDELGLLGPCHHHAIGTFNTCSRGPTHRTLIKTGGSYNLKGADFPHTTPQPSQSMVSPFHLRAPPSLQFNHRAPTNQR
jgi:hypothetical protein